MIHHRAPLVDNQYLLKKFEMKGGWTYAEIPQIRQNPKVPFGWVQVCGSVDGFDINQYKLMPMGNGNLFLPIKAEIRKKIGKNAGDWVHVILYADDSEIKIPDTFMVCLLESPKALAFFEKLTDSNKKYYIDWIFEAKKFETQVNRMAKAIDNLEKGKGW